MKPTIVISVLLTLIVSTATAQTISVRSGEHDTFTRLVLYIPAGAEWSIDQADQNAAVRLALPGVRFDTRQVFQRIRKKRLLSLAQTEEGGVLNLELACDCGVVGFNHSSRMLVVDIRDEPPEKVLKLPQPLHLGRHSYRFNQAYGSQSVPDMKLPLQIDPAPDAGENLAPAVVALQGAETSGLNRSELRLLEQIGRASEQGLLSPIQPILEAPEIEGAAISVTSNEMPERASGNVSAMTVVDEEFARISDSVSRFQKEKECLDPTAVGVQNWGQDAEFANRIGNLRANLYSEFDRLNSEAVADLAKAYLYYGFGAEAREAIGLASDTVENTDVMLAMADVLDNRDTSQHSAFVNQQNCETDVAMWAVLSNPKQAWDANTDAVARAFSRLPGHLRSHLGPRLSRIFTDVDELELASAILRKIEISEETPQPDQNFASAAIDKSHGDAEAAAAKMAEVIDTDSEFSPQALIELVDTHWRERMPVAPDMHLLAASYAAEYRGTDLGDDLQRTRTVALALSGDFETAYEAYQTLQRRDPKTDTRQALIPLLYLLAENAGDVAFLKIGLSVISDPDTKLPTELTNKLARRLIDLGFAEPALTLLASSGSQQVAPERKLMRAEAALALNLPHRALVELLSVQGPEAVRLRAQAMAQNGDHRLAGQVFRDAEMNAEAARDLWLGEDWETGVDDQSSPYARMAEVSSQLLEKDMESLPQTPLAQARALLDESQSARSQLVELLEFTEETRRTE
ncbi:hypothetical protein I5535_01215 [Rhodobacteraceae bacterium F11138]|nr:hypothetical protein [Rhodobacteraceae bacterium F11138]